MTTDHITPFNCHLATNYLLIAPTLGACEAAFALVKKFSEANTLRLHEQ